MTPVHQVITGREISVCWAFCSWTFHQKIKDENIFSGGMHTVGDGKVLARGKRCSVTLRVPGAAQMHSRAVACAAGSESGPRLGQVRADGDREAAEGA